MNRALKTRLIAGALIALTLFAAAAAAQPERLPAAVVKTLKKYRIPTAAFSAYVHPLGAARPLLSVNAELPRQPASTIKVLTTFAALEILGPTYTWKTEARLLGPLRGGVLDGDLLLKGYGDPFLTTERFWKLLRALRQRGLQTVSGRLLIDNRFLQPAAIATGAFDNRPRRAYNARPSALMVNFQAIAVHLRPLPGRGVVDVYLDPRPDNVTVDNRVQYVDGRCRGRRVQLDVSPQRDGSRLVVSGRLPSGCGDYALHRLLLPPRQQIYGVFRTLWRQLGGRFDGALGDYRGAVAESKPAFYTQTSPPLAEIIRGMNKFSNNVMTRQLLLTLGAERYGAPGTEQKGRRAVLDWLAASGLDFPELRLDNGAGLSRSARLSARSMGRLLLAAAASRFAPELMASLPLAALDGTLRRRFQDEPLAGWVRLKTGSLNNVEAVAGFLTAQSGRRFAVVAIHNHPGVSRGSGDRVNDELLRWLYRQ